MTSIPLTRPSIGDAELRNIGNVLASGRLVCGPRVQAFETALCRRFGFDHAVAVASGTHAILLSLRALDIGPGSEVIVPDFCFPSVAAAVLQTGAECVLCDIDPQTFCLNPQTVDAVVTDRTAAVIAVHQFGIPCGASAVQDSVSCPVIEDAACALGATDDGGLCGTQTELSCFSFHPRKIITTAEGGLIVTRDPAVAERCRWLRSHGFHRTGDCAVFEELGHPARMSEVHAAIGLGQLERFDAIVEGRKRAALLYRNALSTMDGIQPSTGLWHTSRVYQSLVVMLASGIDRNAVIAMLSGSGIESTIGTFAIHRQKPFGRCRVPARGLPGSVAAAEQSLTLPLWPEMTDGEVARVTDALRRALH